MHHTKTKPSWLFLPSSLKGKGREKVGGVSGVFEGKHKIEMWNLKLPLAKPIQGRSLFPK